MYKFFLKKSLTKAHKILTNSNSTALRIKNLYKNTDINFKITTLLPPINFIISKIKLNAPSFRNRPIKDKYIIFVGTVEPRKNLEEFILQFNKFISIHENHRFLKFVIIGEIGWMQNNFSKLISESNNITHITNICDHEKFFYINHAEFLVLPSLYEGLGIPIIEAKILGTPVLISNVPELVEAANGSKYEIAYDFDYLSAFERIFSPNYEWRQINNNYNYRSIHTEFGSRE